MYLLKPLSPARIINLIMRTTVDDQRSHHGGSIQLVRGLGFRQRHGHWKGHRLTHYAICRRSTLHRPDTMSLMCQEETCHGCSRRSSPTCPDFGQTREYIWEHGDTTCSSIWPDLQLPGHKPLVCNKYNRFWETKLRYGEIPYTERSTSQQYLCERPLA